MELDRRTIARLEQAMRLEQAIRADRPFEIARHGFHFSVSLFAIGTFKSLMENHMRWNGAAGIGALGIVGTWWFAHRRMQQIQSRPLFILTSPFPSFKITGYLDVLRSFSPIGIRIIARDR
jgi:hypothetical protein